MKKKLTVKQISALIILEKTDYFNTMTNKIFAEKNVAFKQYAHKS